MKKICKSVHLWLSLPFGLLISVICFSGAVLVFEREITQALQHHLYEVESEGKEVLPSTLLESRVRDQLPDTLEITSIKMPEREGAACMVSFKNAGKRMASVNPYTGEVIGFTYSYPFFQTMRKLHRWLLDPPARRGEGSVGKMVVGFSTLAMVFVLLSGLVIWVPRNHRALNNRLRISFTKGWRRFCYDAHVSLGFYALLFLMLMALTGLTWSFGGYRTVVYEICEAILPGGQSPKVFLYTLHTGRWGGMLTQVIYFLAALIGGLLPLTGYYLWWKKRK